MDRIIVSEGTLVSNVNDKEIYMITPVYFFLFKEKYCVYDSKSETQLRPKLESYKYLALNMDLVSFE